MTGSLPVRFAALIFDFDGVLIESEYLGNKHIADYLTMIGHPTTPQQSMANFMGLAGQDFIDAVERHIGRPLPDDFQTVRGREDERVMREGIGQVVGAAAFVSSLPDDLPIAIASSSSTRWIERHLRHIGLADRFGDKLFSGREHVSRGKPAPDIYLHAAAALGVPIDQCAIIEDSPVGVTGAVASGAYVIGFTAGSHCPPDHGAALLSRGVHALATSYPQLAERVSQGTVP
jgi:beta-phosphoglucomutase-like phosphatase (HAD superfamily)